MNEERHPRLARLSKPLASISVAAALLFAGPMRAEPASEPIRRIGMMEQLEHCRSLVRNANTAATLDACFRHVDRLLAEGLRRRRAAPSQSPEFEQQLELGAKAISARLAALSFDDAEQLDRGMRDLDDTILDLRGRLASIEAEERLQISLVSRGGVSLGNWQAGFLFSVTEWAKTRRGRQAGAGAGAAAFSTVTGASAGAVNGLTAAIEGCKSPNLVAEESLYYEAWMDLGLFGRYGAPGLFPTEERGSTALALFTNDVLEATLEKAKRYVQDGRQIPSCSVDFGFVATHLDPKVSPVHVRPDGDPILSTKKLKEKFSVRLAFDGSTSAETAVRIENIGPTGAASDDQIYYAGLGHTKDVSLETLMLGVRASGAFPAAFPPVDLDYTQFVPGPDGTILSHEREATFIDGGVLDNTPVGLAVALDDWRAGSKQPDPDFEGLLPGEPRTYIFLEPLVRSWIRGGHDQAQPDAASSELLGTYLGFTRDLLATTTDAQLSNTAEQFAFVRRQRRDWAEPRLSVPERNMPIAAAQFDHFMGFLERDFRIFDFYVGMADAHVYLAGEACLTAPDGEDCELPERLVSLDTALKAANPNYRCIRAYYDSEAATSRERITTANLPPECATLREAICKDPSAADSPASVREFLASREVLSEAGEDLCMAPTIANHNFRAMLAGMHNLKVWMISDEYSESGELDRYFAELSKGEPSERFIYVDLPTHLGLRNGYLEPAKVKQAFRTVVQQSVDSIASEQDTLSRYVLKMVGRAGADVLYGKDYPGNILAAGMAQSGLEAMYGRRLWWPKLRWDTTGRVFNLRTRSYAFGLEPFTLEFYAATQGTWVWSPAPVVDIELGAGWALNETVAVNGRAPGHVVLRTGPRSSIALVALQRLYLALNIDYYPIRSVAGAYETTGTTVGDSWNWNLSAGWRFLY